MRRNPPFVPFEISVDPQTTNVLFGREENDQKRRLWISMDFGLSWKAEEEYVMSATFGRHPTLDIVNDSK